MHALADGFGEIIDAEIPETSNLVGRSISESDLPHGVLIGAIVRGGEVIIPRGNTVMQVDDRIVLFAETSAIRAIESLFAVRLEFF